MAASETQGERAYRSGDPRSERASSAETGSRTPDLKAEQLAPGAPGDATHTSPTDPSTPRIGDGGDGSMTAASFNDVTDSFQAVKCSPSSGHKRSASQAKLPDPDSYHASSPGPSIRGSCERLPPHTFAPSSEELGEGNPSRFMIYATAPPQPLPSLLQIPDDNWISGLPYNNSPWCSSASDSTYSSHSNCSRNGPQLAPRGRSQSISTLPDWPAGSHWSPHRISSTPQEMRSPAGFDADQYETQTPFASPTISPILSRRRLLDIPNFSGTFFMDTVATPACPDVY